MKRTVVKPLIRAAESLGCRVVHVRITGKTHYRITVEHEGREHGFVTAGTPSDVRGLTKFTADVRRWMRQGGQA